LMGLFLITTTSTSAQEPTQPSGQSVSRAFTLGAKQLGHEANHSSPPSAKVKNMWHYISTPLICLHGILLSLPLLKL